MSQVISAAKEAPIVSNPAAAAAAAKSVDLSKLMNPALSAIIGTELHKQFIADAKLRKQVTWPHVRLFQGLAVHCDSEAFVQVGDLQAFVNNKDVTWISMRDIPASFCPGDRKANRETITRVVKAQATLRYGMPHLVFNQQERDALNFSSLPSHSNSCELEGRLFFHEVDDPFVFDSRRTEEFAALNALSAAMTDAAFFSPANETAYSQQQAAAWSAAAKPATRMVPPAMQAAIDRRLRPEAFMPEPWLCFALRDLAAVEAAHFDHGDRGEQLLTCRHCKCDVRLGTFQRLAKQLSVEFTGPGVFKAFCPGCDDAFGRENVNGRNSWSLKNIKHAEGSRHYSPAIREAFITDHMDSMNMPASLRDGNTALREQWDWMRTQFGYHQFDLEVKNWFLDQLRFNVVDGCVLVPARWASHVHAVTPVDLWWEMSPITDFLLPDSNYAVLPPIRVFDWREYVFELPGNISLDVTPHDPRFSFRPGPYQSLLIQAAVQPPAVAKIKAMKAKVMRPAQMPDVRPVLIRPVVPVVIARPAAVQAYSVLHAQRAELARQSLSASQPGSSRLMAPTISSPFESLDVATATTPKAGWAKSLVNKISSITRLFTRIGQQ